MPIRFYAASDFDRLRTAPAREGSDAYRTPSRRDFARLIHSPSFRRLQGKTQLFPGAESDFFRNRLTHSIEVAQIAKSIAMKINSELDRGFQDESVPDDRIDYDLVEFAALAHDLGHPPFGHNGEKALDDCARRFGGFEGNAQTLRILCKLEKKQESDEEFPAPEPGEDSRRGLNLTFRSLASILKYDREIPLNRGDSDPLEKGYYGAEQAVVSQIKRHVLPPEISLVEPFKTIECSIMDLADDIAYCTYDLEDALKGGFVSPLGILTLLAEDRLLVGRVCEKVNRKLTESNIPEIDQSRVIEVARSIFKTVFGRLPSLEETPDTEGSPDSIIDYEYRVLGVFAASERLGKDGYTRSDFTGSLVDRFIRSVRFLQNDSCAALSAVTFDDDTAIEVEVLKHLNYEIIIRSPRLKIVEHRGYGIVKAIYNELESDEGFMLLPSDWRSLYERLSGENDHARLLCDFIAGMTDRYAWDFYSRIKGAGESIFRPI